MSGITGKDALGLFEAYHAIYTPQEELDEGLRPLPKEKMERQATKAYGKEVRAAAAGDEKETNKQMKRRFAMQSPSSRRTELLNKEEVDIFDEVLEFLQVEGYADTLEEAEWLMANVIDEEAIGIICELTGGKGHPGYKAGSKDHGPMQSGHPADSRKRQVKGGTMSMRHGDHLGDIDDDDDDDDDYESIVKQQSRDSRERVRKPLRNKVRAARNVLSKEEYMDEAQEARNNPEKYEREQSKKYAPVRGERTPMPPRGDKRREDFEKWYAKNVR
jgi:hypothetical protein